MADLCKIWSISESTLFSQGHVLLTANMIQYTREFQKTMCLHVIQNVLSNKTDYIQYKHSCGQIWRISLKILTCCATRNVSWKYNLEEYHALFFSYQIGPPPLSLLASTDGHSHITFYTQRERGNGSIVVVSSYSFGRGNGAYPNRTTAKKKSSSITIFLYRMYVS
jgi:hypothetical protein